jgi:hypothetical protein
MSVHRERDLIAKRQDDRRIAEQLARPVELRDEVEEQDDRDMNFGDL